MKMERDSTHIDFIKRWAKRVREDKEGSWREEHSQFINAQYDNAYRVIELLKKKENGKKKLRKMYKISNTRYNEFY